MNFDRLWSLICWWSRKLKRNVTISNEKKRFGKWFHKNYKCWEENKWHFKFVLKLKWLKSKRAKTKHFFPFFLSLPCVPFECFRFLFVEKFFSSLNRSVWQLHLIETREIGDVEFCHCIEITNAERRADLFKKTRIKLTHSWQTIFKSLHTEFFKLRNKYASACQ